MKKKKIMKLVSGIILMFVGLHFHNVQVDAKTIMDTTKDKTYQIDLDQDGKKEKVKLKQCSIDDLDYNYYGIIYVDGKKAYTTPKDIYAYDINMKIITSGDQVFINVSQSSDNGNLEFNKLLSFNGTTLDEVIDFKKVEPGLRSCEITSATKDKIVVSCESMPCQLASIKWKSTYLVNGNAVKIKSHVHKVKSGIEGRSISTLETNRTVTFTSEIGSKKVAFKLGAGKKVKLLSITTKKDKIYGCFQYGKKKGYVRVDPYHETAYFKNIYKYLAG
ncbi:hypothetical protein [Anaerosporobacter sp.]